MSKRNKPGRRLSPEERAACKMIADVLGEKEDTQRHQIRRIVQVMGVEWTRQRVIEAADAFDTGAAIAMRKDGTPRTVGGVFFTHARAMATPLAEDPARRRDFFRAFFAKEPKPKVKQPPPPPKPKPVAKTPKKPEKRRGPVMPEVYVMPRRST